MTVDSTAILVTGMHRSGTSLVTQILHLHGVAVTQELEPANEFNVTGYWESRELIGLHREVLNEAHSQWQDVGEIPGPILDSGLSESSAKAIKSMLRREFSDEPLIAIKDPRISRFLPLWVDMLRSCDIGVKVLIPFRNPDSVAKSLERRDEMHRHQALMLWARHILDAERFSRHLDRAFVEYEALLENWQGVMEQVVEDLALELPISSGSIREEVDAIILQDENHYKARAHNENADDIEEITREIYQALLSGEVKDNEVVLDRLLVRLDSYCKWISPILNVKDTKLEEQATEILEKNTRLEEQTAVILNQENNCKEAARQLRAHEHTIKEMYRHQQRLDADIARLDQALNGKKAELEQSLTTSGLLQNLLVEKGEEIDTLVESLSEQAAITEEQRDRISELQSFVEHYQAVLSRTEAELDEVHRGNSWRVTAPLRVARRAFSTSTRGVRRVFTDSKRFLVRSIARASVVVWRKLPLSAHTKIRLKAKIFNATGSLFSETNAYRAWQAQNYSARNDHAVLSGLEPGLKTPHFRPIYQRALKPPGQVGARLIAFYLPQFHAIPENDEWWGKGFTEWTNVRKAEPSFPGHYQPHIPSELGYYNLLDEGVQASQVELAKLYGLQGFCFYFYWFGGKRLLEAPVENFFSDSSIEFQACLCWANENWSRRWDGLDEDILIGQNYSPEDDIAFIAHIARYVRSPKYIRVDGRPLILVYRPSELPDPKASTKRWRKWCRENGIGEIYLAYTQSFEAVDPAEYGFDAAVEFPPNNSAPPQIVDQVQPYKPDYSGLVYDWRIFLERSKNYTVPQYTLYRSVCPSWDNTARKKERGTYFANSNPADYQAWLENAIEDTRSRISSKDDRLIFVNAWNEWAEGAHLEPDSRYGYAYLDATRNALTGSSPPASLGKVLLVTHDAHPHGAQFLVLNLAKLYASMGIEISILVAGDGPLVDRYSEVAPVKVLGGNKSGLPEYLQSLVEQGYGSVLLNSVASGWLADSLAEAKLRVVSLVHELPRIIQSMNLKDAAFTMLRNTQMFIFASDMVRQGFEQVIAQEVPATVMPQGLYKKNSTLARQGRDYCRAGLRRQYKLPDDAFVVIGVGGGDLRKGIDLFVEIANSVTRENSGIYFIWVGKVLEDARKRVDQLLSRSPVSGNIFIEDSWQDTDIFYGGADLYSLTSREDPFPSVVLEAFDASLPVIAFDECGGFTDIVNSSTGYLARPFEVEEYARAIVDLERDPGLRKSKGAAGKTLVDHEYSFYRYGFHLLEFAGIELKRISAVLPNYNYAHLIKERISNICNQSYPLYELLVLDDCSTDNSIELVESVAIDIHLPHTVLVNEENSGSVFRQWKKGVDQAVGDYIWVAEADDLAELGFLELVSAPFNNDDVVLSYCQSTQMTEEGFHLAPDYFAYTDDISTQRWREDYMNDGVLEISEALCVKNTIPNVSAVVFEKKSLSESLSYLFERLVDVKVAGDWLVYLYVLQKGSIAYSAKSLNHHRRHESSVTSSLAAERHYQEVRDAQLLARELAPVNEKLLATSDDYARHLIEHFQLVDQVL